VTAEIQPTRTVGRYAVFDEIGSGGMATVHVGRLRGKGGFTRIVAIKQLRANYANDPEFRPMFVDEARLSARITNLNVVPTLDVVEEGRELFLVLEYVRGASLGQLLSRARKENIPVPVPVVAAIFSDALKGLHAAHETKDDRGSLVDLVHRDISPENILVGADGSSRVLDFGIAKAVGRLQNTREGVVRGKIAYMAPEQFQGSASRRTDVYAAAVVMWETLVGELLFASDDHGKTLEAILSRTVQRPSKKRPEIPRELDRVVLRGLEHDPQMRFSSAREMAIAIENAVPRATTSEVGAWVESLAADILASRDKVVALAEQWKEEDVADLPETKMATDPRVSVAPAATPRRRRAIYLLPLVLVAPLLFLFLSKEESLPLAAPSPTVASTVPEVAEPTAVTAVTAAPPVNLPPFAHPSAAVSATVISESAKKPPAAPLSKPKPAEKVGCNPPYYFDSDGKKHFKRECL